MNKNNHKKIFSLSLLLFLILLTGAIVFRFYINNITENVLILKQEAMVIKNNDVTALKLKFNQLDTDRIKIDNYFIDVNNVAGFLDSLDVLGEQSGADFEIQSVSLKENKDGDMSEFNNLLISTKVFGDWEDVISFILAIENINKKVLIDALRISSVFDSETEEVNWNLIMNLRGIAK